MKLRQVYAVLDKQLLPEGVAKIYLNQRVGDLHPLLRYRFPPVAGRNAEEIAQLFHRGGAPELKNKISSGFVLEMLEKLLSISEISEDDTIDLRIYNTREPTLYMTIRKSESAPGQRRKPPSR